MRQDNSLQHLFWETIRMYHNISCDRFKKIGLHRGQPPILKLLNHKEGQSQKELMQDRPVSPATLTRSLQRLEKNGFIEKKADPSDNRLSRVYLTGKGREAVLQLEELDKAISERVFRGFSESERSQFKAFLKRMQSNIGFSNDTKPTRGSYCAERDCTQMHKKENTL